MSYWDKLNKKFAGKRGLTEAAEISVEVHAHERAQYGGNPTMSVTLHGLPEFQGKPMKTVVFRQGGLGFWAFSQRPKLGRESAKVVDAQCDQAWEKVEGE